MRSSTWFFNAILLKTPMALVDFSCFSSATRSSGMGGAVAGVAAAAAGAGVFATGALATGELAAGALTFGATCDLEGGAAGVTGDAACCFEDCVTGGFTANGPSFSSGAVGGGDGGFTADASVVFSGATGGGTADSPDETAAGGFSVPREHALNPMSPMTIAALKQIRVNNITVTSPYI